ncbi:hypothetical protein BNJ_00465 [Kaumoebavirus]|nr:hypothetical protein BNJ_00001 [Kaumoebavirus]YP_009352857.1 hypothetical protein BNJ_00465 [Kaumoebavirus]ARA71849.1 hypothetical protein BNJ_00001 [Kaumoebavirus]ARA72277.1 hypothetical protein BNJ_00465 [Kaumoebavirus]
MVPGGTGDDVKKRFFRILLINLFFGKLLPLNFEPYRGKKYNDD